MPAIQLTPAERKEQRAAAHHLDPVVLIGADGPDARRAQGGRRRAERARPDQGARVLRRPRGARSDLSRPGRRARAPRRSSTSASCWCCGGRCRRRTRPSAKADGPGPRVESNGSSSSVKKSGNHRPQVRSHRIASGHRQAASQARRSAAERQASSEHQQASARSADAPACKAPNDDALPGARGRSSAAPRSSRRPCRTGLPAAAAARR